MTEIRLPDLRIGFGYAADLNFPPGFLAVEEDVRAALRRYPGQMVPDAVFSNTRTGDTVTIELTEAQTRLLAPGTFLTEAVVYQPGTPGEGEIVLVDNQFRIEANYSPSGPAYQIVPAPISVSDFRHGTYLFNGASCLVSDLWVTDLNWSAEGFDPARDIIPGLGLSKTHSGTDYRATGPAASPELLAALGVPGPFISVYEYSISASTPAQVGVSSAIGEIPGFTAAHEWNDTSYHNTGVAFDDYITSVEIPPFVSGTKKVAFMTGPPNVSLSLNGAPTLQIINAADSGANSFGLYVAVGGSDGVAVASATLHRLTLYPPGDPLTLLPILSA